jgi:hypothetical protein
MPVNYDVLVYHDFVDTTRDTPLAVGADAHVGLGFEHGLHVVAVAPPIHEGKDATIVLANHDRPMADVQKRLAWSAPKLGESPGALG